MAEDDMPAPLPKAAFTPAPLPVAAPQNDPLAAHVTIADFCRRKMAGGYPIEMLGAFHRAEIAGGTVKDAHDSFDARLTAFETLPA